MSSTRPNPRGLHGCPAGQGRGEVCPAAGAGTQNQPRVHILSRPGRGQREPLPEKTENRASPPPEIQAKFGKITTCVVPPRKQTPLKNQAHAAV